METFGKTLRDLRVQRNIKTEELAKKANVPASLISGLQTEHRTVGERNARQIGVALGLTGPELDDFIYLALNHARDRVLRQYQSYPAETLNLIAERLETKGITPDQITGCCRHPYSAGQTSDAAVYLNNGQIALINLNITVN